MEYLKEMAARKKERAAPAYACALRVLAQRLRCAAAIFLRASGLKTRLPLTLGDDPFIEPKDALALLPLLVPCNKDFTCCSRDISSLMLSKISLVFKTHFSRTHKVVLRSIANSTPRRYVAKLKEWVTSFLSGTSRVRSSQEGYLLVLKSFS